MSVAEIQASVTSVTVAMARFRERHWWMRLGLSTLRYALGETLGLALRRVDKLAHPPMSLKSLHQTSYMAGLV